MNIIPWVIITLSLLVVGGIVWRHLAELRMLNVETLPETKKKQIKESILAQRLGRIGQKQRVRVKQLFSPVFFLFERSHKRLQNRIHELELAYEHAKRLTLGSRGKRTAHILELIREAIELEQQEKYDEAEKKYIAVISLDQRNVDAYEGLGNLYLKMQKCEESEEALKFILKFRPNDASVLVSLGELSLAEGKNSEALTYFDRAVTRRPGNPKYLDFLIETAILVGNQGEAVRALELMRSTNPDNQKITDWEHRIAALTTEAPSRVDQNKT